MQLSEDNIFRILGEVLKPESSDTIFFKIENVEPIRENDQYGGIRVSIICKMDNIKQTVKLDIATGDVITPGPINYMYASSFGEQEIPIYAYPIETILAEKIQTIYSRGFLNSRSKDYYDLYIIYKLKRKDIDINTLLDACKNTFAYRKTEFNLDALIMLLKELKTDEGFLKRWKGYIKKNTYANDITFEEVIDTSIELIMTMKNNQRS